MKLRLLSLIIVLSFTLIPSLVTVSAQVTAGSEVQLINPIGGSAKDGGNKQGVTNVKTVVGNAIQIALGIIGSLTLVAFIYGGFQWLTSAGDAEKVRTGSNAMLYSTIGLFIIFGAYAILNTILKGIAK